MADCFVEKLNGTISERNRNMTLDNWFTTVPLGQNPLHECHITTVGTIKKRKKEKKNTRRDEKQKNTKIVS